MRWSGPDAFQWIEHFHAKNPDDTRLSIALGRFRTIQGQLKEAKTILEAVLKSHPQNLDALAALIACLREADEPDELARVQQMLPPQSAEDPWLLLLQRGALANRDGKSEEAVAAYEQLLQQDRTAVEAWQGLGQATRLLGDLARSKHALKMSSALGRIQNHLGKAIQASMSPDSFLDVADLCAEIDLNREGAIMTRCALRLDPRKERVRSAVELFRAKLIADREPGLLGP